MWPYERAQCISGPFAHAANLSHAIQKCARTENRSAQENDEASEIKVRARARTRERAYHWPVITGEQA